MRVFEDVIDEEEVDDKKYLAAKRFNYDEINLRYITFVFSY